MDRPSEKAHDTIDTARELLLALNARADLSRGAICRLARELRQWHEAVRPDIELARRLSIDLDALSRAFELRTDAGAMANDQLRRAEKWGARIMTSLDDDYPASLHQLELPPPVLFAAGPLFAPAGDSKAQRYAGNAIAIVGSRKASPYGIEIATWLGKELASAGVTVVSGFARGVDAAAHRGALAAESGATLAILGCGLGVDYPRGQNRLASEIRERGALLSEFPCEAPPLSRNFPVRNRLIANLTRATVVVEAAPRSGSLVTARLALEAGREVFAVPGRITEELALGTNALLADGAGVVTHPADLLEALGWSDGWNVDEPGAGAEQAAPPSLGELELSIWSALDRALERSPDELCHVVETSVDEVVGVLLDLELAGHVTRVPGGGYRRR